MDLYIFISQPMRGLTDDEILANRNKAINEAKLHFAEDDNIVVIDSFLKDYDPGTTKCTALMYLGKSLQLMSNADAVCFAPGWEDARGCRIEHECAKEYGKHLIYL